MYADDITIWMTRGSLEENEEKLQEVATCVENYVKARDLACSTEKLEILRVWQGKQNRTVLADDGELKLEIYLEGKPIPKKPMIRILGMWIQLNQRCTHTFALLKASTLRVACMIKWVWQKRYGMSEEDMLKLVRSLVVSRMTYSLPYFNLTQGETKQAEAILRHAYKAALQLPNSTPTKKLMTLGLLNTLDKLKKAQLVTQLQRLMLTPTGREVLRKLGCKGALVEIQRTDNTLRTQTNIKGGSTA